MIRRPPRSTQGVSSAASDVYKRQRRVHGKSRFIKMADPDQPSDYKIEKENGEVGVSSREYTGKAKATYSNGETYDGDFVEGIREGKGKYIYASGFEYEGEFQANHRHGIGKMSYKGKEAYLGDCLLYTSPSPRDLSTSRMPSSA
eukprot:TRINITY_DN23082_c0_g1_i1.p1 TRINITY_DN23082_c0_g1~~TRINITY_DN23082_c0_g1_i1.p1  ORF type:complete len:145 (-),score=43.01 TRINITY_DN23082_c0_g1_i1:79-513(-)